MSTAPAVAETELGVRAGKRYDLDGEAVVHLFRNEKRAALDDQIRGQRV